MKEGQSISKSEKVSRKLSQYMIREQLLTRGIINKKVTEAIVVSALSRTP